jgi:hypothetical protein
MDLSPFTSESIIETGGQKLKSTDKDLQPINHLKGFSIDVPLTNVCTIFLLGSGD